MAIVIVKWSVVSQIRSFDINLMEDIALPMLQKTMHLLRRPNRHLHVQVWVLLGLNQAKYKMY
jgi:hypothetical protein